MKHLIAKKITKLKQHASVKENISPCILIFMQAFAEDFDRIAILQGILPQFLALCKLKFTSCLQMHLIFYLLLILVR